jgi:hypothetical protein
VVRDHRVYELDVGLEVGQVPPAPGVTGRPGSPGAPGWTTAGPSWSGGPPPVHPARPSATSKTRIRLAGAELAVAAQVRPDQLNAQSQPLLTWPASFTLVRATFAQAERTGTLSRTTVARLARTIDLTERHADRSPRAAAALLRTAATQLDDEVAGQAELAAALDDLAGTLD